MGDHGHVPPAWVRLELRRRVRDDAGRRAHIMAVVREEAARRRWDAGVVRGARSVARAGVRGGVLAAAVWLAAGLAGTAIGARAGAALYGVLARGRVESSATMLGDTIIASLHDTLRLVRFELRAPGARRVALAGDFNGWSLTAAPLAFDTSAGAWRAVLALPRRDLRAAFLVDDTRWVAAPRISRRAPARDVPLPSGRPTSRGDST